MEPHTHQAFVEGCYACDLLQRLSELRTEKERLRHALNEIALADTQVCLCHTFRALARETLGNGKDG